MKKQPNLSKANATRSEPDSQIKSANKNKKPTRMIAFSTTEEMNNQLSSIAHTRRQSKSTVIKTCISEALYADLPAEALIYSELSFTLNNEKLSDEQKLTETKDLIKKLMKLRRQSHD